MPATPPPDGQAVPPSLITPELLAAFRVGEVSGRYTFLVTREHIKRFAGVLAHRSQEEQVIFDGDLGDGPPLAAPTVFFSALDPLELRIMSHDHGLDLIPFRKTGGGNAFNEIEYDRPILSGDIVTVAVTFTDIYERDGRSGRLLFRVRENLLTDQRGERIGVARSGHAYAFEVPGYQPPPPGKSALPSAAEPASGEELPPLTRTPTIETLIRYAAAADDFAPLHFDHNYALTRWLRRGHRAWVSESGLHGNDGGGLGGASCLRQAFPQRVPRPGLPRPPNHLPGAGGSAIHVGRTEGSGPRAADGKGRRVGFHPGLRHRALRRLTNAPAR